MITNARPAQASLKNFTEFRKIRKLPARNAVKPPRNKLAAAQESTLKVRDFIPPIINLRLNLLQRQLLSKNHRKHALLAHADVHDAHFAA